MLGKKKLGYHGSAHHSQLRYDSHHLWRSTVQWSQQPINRTKLWLFLDALLAFAILLADLHSKIDNSAYLRNIWVINELRRWTQFFDKKVDLRPTFQEPIYQKFCLAVDRSASILTPAVFWKTSHLNPAAKFFTLLSNRGPIAANGDESMVIINTGRYSCDIFFSSHSA